MEKNLSTCSSKSITRMNRTSGLVSRELAKRVAEIERRHGDQLQCLVVRIKELESAANTWLSRRRLKSKRVRTQLENKLRSEHLHKEASGTKPAAGNRDGEDYPRGQVRKVSFGDSARTGLA